LDEEVGVVVLPEPVDVEHALTAEVPRGGSCFRPAFVPGRSGSLDEEVGVVLALHQPLGGGQMRPPQDLEALECAGGNGRPAGSRVRPVSCGIVIHLALLIVDRCDGWSTTITGAHRSLAIRRCTYRPADE